MTSCASCAESNESVTCSFRPLHRFSSRLVADLFLPTAFHVVHKLAAFCVLHVYIHVGSDSLFAVGWVGQNISLQAEIYSLDPTIKLHKVLAFEEAVCP